MRRPPPVTHELLVGMGLAVSAGSTVRSRPVGRGETAWVELVEWVGPDGAGRAVLKRPAPGLDPARADRERRFLAELGPLVGVRTPRLLGTGPDLSLALEALPGTPAPAAAGCDPELASAVLCTTAVMHRRFADGGGADLSWLPRWGQGTAGANRPHARRARRFRSRIEAFSERFHPEARAALHRVAEHLEADLAAASALPTTLIHADLHLGNVLLDDAAPPALLDWQSASRGPALYDAVRFLVESLGEGVPDEALAACVAEWAGAAGWTAHAAGAELPRMVRIVWAGLVSGSATRTEEGLDEGERRAIERASRRALAWSDVEGGEALTTSPARRR
jgi:hypothetical protein